MFINCCFGTIANKSFVKKSISICSNVVCTFNTHTELDLKKIANHTRNAEYNPGRFPACMMRLRDPRCTAMIFSSGKITITGTKTENDALLAGNKVVKILKVKLILKSSAVVHGVM
jgi:transcription initiation factor TFIID TATA-box-binding protein